MIIDTTINANSFEKNFRKIYFKNYINQRKEYSSWIDSIGDKKNLDWWISLPASRNYNYSKLFHIFSKKKVDLSYEIIYNAHTTMEGRNIMTFNTAMQATLVLTAYIGFIAVAMISTSLS